LTNPAIDPPSGTIALLADLEVRNQAVADRRSLRDKLMKEHAGVLVNSTRARSGPERLNAIFEAWSSLDQQSGEAQSPSRILQDLRDELLRAAKELTYSQQWQFLMTEWDKVAHASLLPLIQRLANTDGPMAWGRRGVSILVSRLAG
jgi:hypothetical protein